MSDPEKGINEPALRVFRQLLVGFANTMPLKKASMSPVFSCVYVKSAYFPPMA